MNQNQMTNTEKKRIETLDKKIEKLKTKVFAKKNELDVIEEELMTLMEERHPERKEERIKQELYDTYLKSDKTLEEIVKLIMSPDILEYLDWTE